MASQDLLGSYAHSETSKAGKLESSANKQEGDTYYATPTYPNTTPEDGSAGAAAAAASRSPHPSGPADTSSMNAPEGKSSQQQGPNTQRNADIHFPGRQEEVLQAQQTAGARSDSDTTPQEKESEALHTDNVQYGGNSTPQGSGSNLSGDSGTRRMKSTFSPVAAAVGDAGRGHSQGGEGAGSDPRPSEPGTSDAANGKVEDEHLEGGRTGGVAAGGDDMTGGGSAGTVAEDQAMAVNPDSGLPQLKSVDDAGAADSGFGQKRDPQQAPERGGEETARQTQKSTGQMPAEAAAG
eukprot:gene5399-5633_t